LRSRYIGGKLEEFIPGDLVLIGKNTPHYYIHDEATRRAEEASVIVIHFNEDFLGTSIHDIPELKPFANLVEQAAQGLKFSGQVIQRASAVMSQMLRDNGVSRLQHLLEVFDILSTSKDHQPIGIHGYNPSLSGNDQIRINAIYAYVATCYQQKIILEEVAQLAHMTPPAFCRYFKRLTRQSFFQFVKEYRVGNACKYLAESDVSISEIAFTNGYNNLSNFNRQFKSVMNVTPKEYRESLRV
jgi:AraC-like DNA-binding protein